MTESEALEILNNECEDISKVQVALKVARETLAEIQRYRAIGTIEEFKDLKKEVELYRNLDKTNFSDRYNKAIDEFFEELQKYEDDDMWLRLKMSSIYEISEYLKAGGKNE